MSLEARALYFAAPGKVELREEQLTLRPGQVLVRSRLIGISHGTEMLAFRGQMPQELEADTTLPGLSGALSYPLKYGYANTGTTDQGTRVFAFFPHQDLFACLPEELIDLPDELDFEDAVFMANLETALGIVHDAAPRVGEAVLLVGQGVVGLLVAEILRRSAAGRIIAVEPYPLRREASRRIGCLVLDPAEAPPERILAETGGRGVDVAINASASEAGLQLAVDSLAFEGTVIEASWYGSRPVELHLGSAFHRKRLKLRSSQVSHIDPALSARWSKQRRYEVVVELLKEIRPSRYITHRFALDQAQQAFELLAAQPESSIQVVLEP